MYLPPELMPNERIIARAGANAIIDVKDMGLNRFVGDKLFWVIGMKGKEGIGGILTMTNLRFVFKAHIINRLRGEFSIPLSQVVTAEKVARFPVYKLRLTTDAAQFDFVCWKAGKFVSKVQATTPDTEAEQAIAGHLAGLKVNGPINAISDLFTLQDRAKSEAKDTWNKIMSGD
ncbi:hypothetical protein [Tateyamaria sp.]|uniref:hypothetical protein n=1 Tax=Tateyamaria sp. TaxID=1929288 RepID=UPI003B219858